MSEVEVAASNGADSPAVMGEREGELDVPVLPVSQVWTASHPTTTPCDRGKGGCGHVLWAALVV